MNKEQRPPLAGPAPCDRKTRGPTFRAWPGRSRARKVAAWASARRLRPSARLHLRAQVQMATSSTFGRDGRPSLRRLSLRRRRLASLCSVAGGTRTQLHPQSPPGRRRSSAQLRRRHRGSPNRGTAVSIDDFSRPADNGFTLVTSDLGAIQIGIRGAMKAIDDSPWLGGYDLTRALILSAPNLRSSPSPGTGWRDAERLAQGPSTESLKTWCEGLIEDFKANEGCDPRVQPCAAKTSSPPAAGPRPTRWPACPARPVRVPPALTPRRRMI